MKSSLSGHTALVLGASQGIGKAAAIALAANGARVHLLARNLDKLQATRDELPRDCQGDILAVDISQRDLLRQKLQVLATAASPVTILVNNTGGPPAGPVANAREEAFVTAFANHLLVNALTAEILLPGMRQAQYGRIINIVSTSVKVPIPGLGVSNTIRGAVASWAKTLANEVASAGVTVNNVLPGATATERLTNIITNKAQSSNKEPAQVRQEMLAEIPAGRFAQPEEIAAAVAFLASPAAGYITGVSLPVDGGRTKCL